MNLLTAPEVVLLTGYKMPLEELRQRRVGLDDFEHNYGVYFLFLGESLQYVGLSKDIATRLEQHLYPEQQSLIKADWFDSISTIEVGDLELMMAVECYYIHAFRPPRNVKYPIPGRIARAMLCDE